MTTAELNQKVADIRSLKALRDETENAIKLLEKDITQFMTENNYTEYIGTDSKITLKEQTKCSLDRERLEMDLGSLDEYEKVTTYQVLRIR